MSYSQAMDSLTELNYFFAEMIRSLTDIFHLDYVFIALAEYGAFLIPLALIYFFLKTGDRRVDSLFVLFTTVLAIQLSHLLGLFYYHPRPFEIYETLLIASPGNTFPSQHAATMFAVAFSFLYRQKLKIGLFFTLLAFLNSFSRVAVGFHFPFDILGGILAAVAALSILTFLETRVESFSKYLDKLQDTIQSWFREIIN